MSTFGTMVDLANWLETKLGLISYVNQKQNLDRVSRQACFLNLWPTEQNIY